MSTYDQVQFLYVPVSNASGYPSRSVLKIGKAAFRYLGTYLLLTGAYISLAKVGMALVLPGTAVSAVWPPTGLALGAMLLFGYRIWPAIFLGAFIVNFQASGIWGVGLGVGVGNTLEALAGAYLYQRYIGPGGLFLRSRNIGRFFLIAVTAPMLSASVGLMANFLCGSSPGLAGPYRWSTWWMENVGGILAFTPFVLAWSPEQARLSKSKMLELAALITCLLFVAALIFGHAIPPLTKDYPLDYLSLPFLMWGAFRLGVKGVPTVVVLLASLPVYFTYRQAGPFYRFDPFESLIMLQMYILTHAATGLLMTAVLSERKEAERKLARSNEELERFAYLASHDLQEPLRTVNSFCTLLDRKSRQGLDDEGKEYLNFISGASRRMYTLINSLLEYSRLGREVPLKITDASLALNDALEELKPAILEAHASVTLGSMPEVLFDMKLLTCIFHNLLDNAIRFRGERPLEVQATCRLEKTKAIFCISDTGIGIEPQYLPRVFGLFQRFAPPGPPSARAGVGLGLALCRRILEGQGERIWVASDPGEGTKIYFSLPLIRPHV